MNDINKYSFAETAQEKRVYRDNVMYVSFSKEESEGLKDRVRDILTESFEERYKKSVAQSVKE